MSKFNIGDNVRRLYKSPYFEMVGPAPHVVTSVSMCGNWLQINNATHTVRGRCNTHPWFADNYELVEETLPPAPESVAYMETDSPLRTHATLLVQPSAYSGYVLLELAAREKGTQDSARTGMRLSADDVLALCHDLRRMAMDIKRKEKDNA